jgi:riboflavin kinase / FMN adenylyltransferase
MFFRRKVKMGSQTGHKIGYPTINLNVGNFGVHHSPGVYRCEVILDNSSYIGALYFGSKSSHKGYVLEVHIIGFNGRVYGQYVRLKIGQKIRDPRQFNSLAELKKQIGKDLEKMV